MSWRSPYLESARLSKGLQTSSYQASILNSLGNAYINRAQVSYRRAYSAHQIGENDAALQQKGASDDAQALGYLQQSLTLAERTARSIGSTAIAAECHSCGLSNR